jgi:predicted transcriptional regulator
MQSSLGLKGISALTECLEAIGNINRYAIVTFCSEKPQRFSDIIFELKLNPATFKFHSKVLIKRGLLEKLERGVYQTTELGNIMLDMVKRADALSKK